MNGPDRFRLRRPADLLPEGDALERVGPGSASADDAHAMANLPEHVQHALLDLPEEYRAAVVLSDVVGLSYEEIAAALGIPLGTVRSRIHRGRAQLRAALDHRRPSGRRVRYLGVDVEPGGDAARREREPGLEPARTA